MWVAGGEGNPFIAYSYDGIHWTAAAAVVAAVYSVAWNGRMWVGVCGAGGFINASSDGINWTAVTDHGGLRTGYGVVWNNPYRGMMNIEQPTIVLGDGSYNTMAYSPDGIAGPAMPGGLGKLMFDGSGSRAAWNGSLWVAVGDPSGNGSPIAY